MSSKFLNKKVWHTGSLRNIENVWKAEQKHDAEQKKLDELRKLEFLYDSGLAVGEGGNSKRFKALESFPKTTSGAESTADTAQASSANDAWRKLHSDPLLMIRQRVQETLARIKNPLSSAHKTRWNHCVKRSAKSYYQLFLKDSIVSIGLGDTRSQRECVEEQKPKKKAHSKKEPRMKHHHSHLKNQKHSSSRKKSDSENVTAEGGKGKTSRHKNSSYDVRSGSEDESTKRESQSGQRNLDVDEKEREGRGYRDSSHHNGIESHFKCRNVAPKLSEEERAAKLQQRWKRLRKAEEEDVRETTQASLSGGRSFLDAAQKRIYGAEKGGSSTIEESVRCRTHYLKGRSEAQERNAFRR
ncbi:hypothetical protein I3842_09G111000 [Carya illinoinensis]|uniref:CBF1-interacting co-repressor CIR N-terminal domain-containing protein n=1 Tax=Carya illinoinensis TaxID=32201 RepID=A0A922E319_CARIL|nr:hypothetical protein I3842_09G111000 [Carya illinoinensis]